MVTENQSHPIYVVAAHPNWRNSHVNRQLRQAAASAEGVALCDLYESYPDYAIDVQAEQEKLSKALQGKDLWLVASTGGPEASYHPQGYNRYFFDAFLPPYEQTAALCGMRFLPPMVLHGAHSAPQADVASHVATFAERLRTYPDWPELAELESTATCDVPDADRPAGSAPLQGDL
ncbi:MAG: NAD(P)H dehydrogenase [Betaproteobacteria bacterium]|nr:NAD(P)H dehydrogenase [Betaproteobacteria bacterium]